jgi:hypothetical protein
MEPWVEDSEGAISEISLGEMNLARLGECWGKLSGSPLCEVFAIGRMFGDMKAWGKDVTFRVVPDRHEPIVYVGWLELPSQPLSVSAVFLWFVHL